MNKCKGCKSQFKAKKSFHSYCSECVSLLCRCQKCHKAVFPKNNTYSCCGIKETVEHVKMANSTKQIGRSLEEIIFQIENKVSSTQAFIEHFGEDAYEDTLPNR